MNYMEHQTKFDEFGTAMQAIKHVTSLQETTRIKEDMQNKFSSLMKVSDEKIKSLDDVIVKYTVDQLQNLTDEEVNSLYIIDGHELVVDLDIKESKLVEFKRDFLVYMKQLEVYGSEIDKSIVDLETSMQEHDIEYKSIIEKYGSMYLIVRGQMEEILSKPSTPEQKKRAENMLSAIDNAISLSNLVSYIEEFNFENMLEDFRYRGEAVYKKHKIVLKRLGIKTDLTKLANLEQLLGLDKEYLEFMNLPMFIAIRYISYVQNPSKDVEGMFVSNLALIYKAVAEGTIREEDKALLISGCKTIIEKAISFKK